MIWCQSRTFNVIELPNGWLLHETKVDHVMIGTIGMADWPPPDSANTQLTPASRPRLPCQTTILTPLYILHWRINAGHKQKSAYQWTWWPYWCGWHVYLVFLSNYDSLIKTGSHGPQRRFLDRDRKSWSTKMTPWSRQEAMAHKDDSLIKTGSHGWQR